MKTKKFNKKLNLNKNTIANLDHGEMSVIKGGYYPTDKYTSVCDCPPTFTLCGSACPD